MLSSLRLSGLVAAGIFASYAAAQATPENDRNLNNGIDVIFIYSDPSVGNPPGSNPPDLSGDFFWTVDSRTQLKSASGSSEVSGLDVFLFDTDWTTPADFYDMLFTRGMTNPAFANNVQPDFTDPNALLLLLGNSGFPNPCTVSPSFCSNSVCPPPGFVVGYEVDIGIGTCANDGIILNTSGSQDNVVTSFVPSGQCFSTCTTGGLCGNGDYSLQGAASTNETQADHFATGYSAEGGFNLGPSTTFNPDGLNERSWTTLQFCRPSLGIAVTDGAGLADGLAGMHMTVTGGTNKLGYKVYDLAGIGANKLMIASSCILAPFPAPGFNIFGAQVMLNLSDPSVTALQRKGAVLLQNNGGAPFDNGVFNSPNNVTVPAGAAGLTLHSQAIRITIGAGITAVESNLTDTDFN